MTRLGLGYVRPIAADREEINRIIFDELVNGHGSHQVSLASCANRNSRWSTLLCIPLASGWCTGPSRGRSRWPSSAPTPTPGAQQIPLGSFAHPVFARSGDTLYVANAAGAGLSAVSVDTTSGLKFEAQELGIPNNYYWGAQGRAWDVAPGGRFLLMKPTAQAGAEPDETPRIRVVVNWAEELKRLVPLP